MPGSENVQVPRERLKEIARAIADGRRDDAEALFREASGKGTIDAAAFVDQLTVQLKAKYPERFTSNGAPIYAKRPLSTPGQSGGSAPSLKSPPSSPPPLPQNTTQSRPQLPAHSRACSGIGGDR